MLGKYGTMRAKSASAERIRIAWLVMFFVLAAAASSAQTGAGSASTLEAALRPGMTAWITDASGREERAQILAASGGVVTARVDDEVRDLRANDITRVRARRSDSVLNGALIGAGAAVATGLFICTRTEPWENCRDDAGPIARIAAIGAGIGIGIDALIRGRKTIYEAGKVAIGVRAGPVTNRRAAGFGVVVAF